MEKEEFDQFIADVNFKSIVNLSLMVGHKLGLFDVLCETDQPMSVREIADKAKLKERYVRSTDILKVKGVWTHMRKQLLQFHFCLLSEWAQQALDAKMTSY